MFSDTHFHLKLASSFLAENQEDQNDPLLKEKIAGQILSAMAERNAFFAMDIGTEADDLIERAEFIDRAVSLIKDDCRRSKVSSMIQFSAGIWPSPEEISNREKGLEILEKQICEFEKRNWSFGKKKIIAIGEGGLDHHWNVSGADHRDEKVWNDDMFNGEEELFAMQLKMAEKKNLPFVIHSRDAFEKTLEVVKKSGYNKGILHCCSYGLEEVKKFLDLGWYISFSGSVTYTKKKNIEEMKKLLSYVPSSKILFETDSPYLSPVPKRGEINTPLNVEHTASFIASARGIKSEDLSLLVDENIKRLFFQGK